MHDNVKKGLVRDYTQDVFVRIYEKLEFYDKNRGDFKNWICGVAYSKRKRHNKNM